MKKLRTLCLIIMITLMCTGCTIEYNITISEDNIDELVIVNDNVTTSRTSTDILTHYEMWYPVFVNYVTEGETIELQDFSQKVNGIEYYEKKINTISNGYQYSYKYKYDIEKYYDSYALATAFINTTVHKTYDSLVLKSGKKNLLCNYDYFDMLKVNITIDPKIYKLNYTNTSNINNNTYTWNLNRSNCDNSQILLTLDIIEQDFNKHNPEEEKKNKILADYALYIFLGILLLLMIVGYKIYQKIKEKNSNFNEDD